MTTEDKLSLMLLEKKDQFKEIYPNHPFITSEVIHWMIKAYNLAIEDAARAAKIGETSRLQAGAGYSRRVTKPTVDKKSILKLKLKL
jgi:hypothetical protein